MAKRRQTDQQRLITFALESDYPVLNGAIESMIAIRDARFPKIAPTPKSKRASRSDKGNTRKGTQTVATDGGEEVIQ